MKLNKESVESMTGMTRSLLECAAQLHTVNVCVYMQSSSFSLRFTEIERRRRDVWRAKRTKIVSNFKQKIVMYYIIYVHITRVTCSFESPPGERN